MRSRLLYLRLLCRKNRRPYVTNACPCPCSLRSVAYSDSLCFMGGPGCGEARLSPGTSKGELLLRAWSPGWKKICVSEVDGGGPEKQFRRQGQAEGRKSF